MGIRYVAMGAFLAVVVAACAGTPGTSSVPVMQQAPSTFMAAQSRVQTSALQPPELIAFRGYGQGALEGWPIESHAGKPQTVVQNPGFAADAMAADGSTLIVADPDPDLVVFYDLATHTETAVPDPYGTPLDIAVDRNADVYVANIDGAKQANVTWYPAATKQPIELTCSGLTFADGIVIDDESNIYVYGDGVHGANVLYEIPNGPAGPQSNTCAQIKLDAIYHGASGLAVDPKTDDLLVMTDPDECAGGEEGLLTIYPKPYADGTAHHVILGGVCPGGIWLNSTSTAVFFSDTNVCSCFSYIRESTYPDGKAVGSYFGGNPGPFVTIPNQLPN